MMNLFEILITVYHMVSAANEYWFGFVSDGNLYVVPHMTFESLSRYFKKDRASSKRGGFFKVRIKASADELRELIPQAILLGPESLLRMPNKGEALEAVLTERYTDGEWKKDSVPFWVAGDIEIEGKQVQVKFNGAELTNEKTIRTHFSHLMPTA